MKSRFRYLTVLPALVLVLGIVLYPVGYLVWMVFHRVSLLALDDWVFTGFANFGKLFRDAELAATLGNTAVFVSESVGIIAFVVASAHSSGEETDEDICIFCVRCKWREEWNAYLHDWL